jgi:hypothetical protein
VISSLVRATERILEKLEPRAQKNVVAASISNLQGSVCRLPVRLKIFVYGSVSRDQDSLADVLSDFDAQLVA